MQKAIGAVEDRGESIRLVSEKSVCLALRCMTAYQERWSMGQNLAVTLS